MLASDRPGFGPRAGKWFSERLGLKNLSYPIPEHANSLGYMLGGITLIGFIILAITGIYLAQFYQPHPNEAHRSIVYIITGAPLGDIVRSIHYWTVQIVMVTVILHMIRVVFSGAYKRPRELNWYVGLALLALTFGFIFTGTVLKYDQEGLEALQHYKGAVDLLGVFGTWFSEGFSRSLPLLTRLYTAHVTILPLAFVLLVLVHLHLIKVHGISPQVVPGATTRATAGEGTSRFTDHAWRLAGFGLLLLGLTIAISLLFPAPIGKAGIPGPEMTKPWWMFVWIVPAEEIWGIRALLIVPGVLGLFLALLPIIDRTPTSASTTENSCWGQPVWSLPSSL